MENMYDIAQKHYNRLFEKMLRLEREGKLKKGVMLLSYRPRPFFHTREHIEKVLSEVENFLMEHHPGVWIPERPAMLQKFSCRSTF